MRIDTHNELASAQRALEELVGDSLRVEAIEGVVEMSPAGDWRSHNLTRDRLRTWFEQRTPAGLLAVTESDISEEPSGAHREPYWRPDVTVFRATADPARGWLLAADVVLTAEVVSPANVAEHGSADAYLASRSRHNAANGIVWLAGVEEHRISWWTGGQLADAAPEWAAVLTVSAWEISG